MAMKLNAQQKAADSAIRAFNAQIEKAYKTLGADNTITKNLVATAKSLYGAGGMREMKIRPHGVVGSIVNPVTGEVSPIPQIARNKANLNNAYKAKELKARTQYTTGSKKGQYKNMYDVTRAYQKAIKQVRQNILKDMPTRYRRTHTPKEIQREINRQMTSDKIQKQQLENDLASEIFAKYAAAQSNPDDDDDFEYLQMLANQYHANGQQIPESDLWNIARNRSETYGNLTAPNNETGISADDLNNILQGGFEDIYNPF